MALAGDGQVHLSPKAPEGSGYGCGERALRLSSWQGLGRRSREPGTDGGIANSLVKSEGLISECGSTY